ncbi:MAG: aminopeptidase P family protein [Dysgonamonadaceae bacterium]|jgi:Xaa-Pro aminopeptidase|nr:aminopeptidase P family protein [Dysgonamonadaceae bacterium]
MTVNKRIELLREAMKAGNIRACIIPSTDSHISEYTPEHWKTRKWISGFSGSAGTVVVTTDKAGLWTDSRYFLQAADQLQGTDIRLFKMGLPDTPTFTDWLAGELSTGDTVGIEGAVFAASEAQSLIRFFTKKNIRVNSAFAPYDSIWNDRPAIPGNHTFILTEPFAGMSARKKIKQTVQAIQKEGAEQTILAALDTIAWLFNLRGNDVEYNPVAVSFAAVSEKETVLFIKPEKLTQEVRDYLTEEGVVLADYEKITGYVKQIPAGTKLLVTPAKINYQLYTAIPETVSVIETNVHPADQLKSIKNETEIAGIRNAMQRDGVALVKFLIDLEKTLAAGETVTELDISRKLRRYRSEQAHYVGESFGTIAGYGPHGAIVHYGATEETNATILPEGILLVDSGAQYFDGTTDITRTLAVGNVSPEMKKDYTNVLKGHIALATARFPRGTTGMQLDALARQFLWQNATNYMHGTGHGVGFFLNVHEGPQNIRMEYNPTLLQPGMLTSNEPGLYRTNAYGIRIENLILTRHDQTTEFGDFYAFETLTLCPIDKKLIDRSLLNEAETGWLNAYHQKVYESLSPFLSEEEKTWLKQQTNEI